MQLYQHQLTAINEFDKHRNVQYFCPRQAGSTTTGLYYSLLKMIGQSKNVVFVSFSKEQSDYSYKHFLTLLEQETKTIDYSIFSDHTNKNIRTHFSSITFISQNQLDNLRGRTFQTLVVDNFDHCSTDNQFSLIQMCHWVSTIEDTKLICSGNYSVDVPNSEKGISIADSLSRFHSVVTRNNEICKPTSTYLKDEIVSKLNTIKKVIELL